jgi:hypothetical protein
MLQTLNLALRVVLELLALVAVGFWGFTLSAPLGLRMLGGLGLPLLLATAWAVFRVPGDGGEPIVVVSGSVRLLLEAAVFGAAVALLAATGAPRLAGAFALVLLLHYGLDYQRVATLLWSA